MKGLIKLDGAEGVVATFFNHCLNHVDNTAKHWAIVIPFGNFVYDRKRLAILTLPEDHGAVATVPQTTKTCLSRRRCSWPPRSWISTAEMLTSVIILLVGANVPAQITSHSYLPANLKDCSSLYQVFFARIWSRRIASIIATNLELSDIMTFALGLILLACKPISAVFKVTYCYTCQK